MQNNLSFWTGVVEDRNDPEQLGRCRVRIFGLHTDNIVDLPTSDLPWALPLQSVTSAAISGLGSTPVGIVPGTWVMGFFLDGETAQKPVILGTLAGKPASNPLAEKVQYQDAVENNPNVLTDSEGNLVLDGQGQPIETTNFENPLDNFGNLPAAEVTKVIDALGQELSGGDYSKEEGGRFGKYQFTYQQLILLGYAYPPKSKIRSPNPLQELYDSRALDLPENWTGRNAVYSKEDFLNKFSVQDDAMVSMLAYNYKHLTRLKKIRKDTEPGIVAGLLSSAHMGGYANADKLGRRTGDQTLRQFFLVGAAAASSQDTDVQDPINNIQEKGTFVPDPDSGPALNSSEFSNLTGFQDPNKQYPKPEYNGLSDLNKLAIGDKSHPVFAKKENIKQTEISKALSEDTWDEPAPVFGAKYPYNQVIETEAGHVIELDNTPGAERIHVFHKAGTHMEIDVNGTMVKKVVGDNYEVIDNNNYVYIKGAQTITVEGRTRILVKDRADIEIEGGLNITSNRDMVIQTAREMGLIAKKFLLSATDGIDMASSGPVNIQGTSVNLSATDGSIVNSATRTIFNTAGEQINNISGENTTMQAGKQFDIKSGTNINIDAGAILNIRMGQAQNATSVSPKSGRQITPPEFKQPEVSDPDPQDRDIKGQDSHVLDDDPDGSAEYIKREIDNDRMSDTIELPDVPDDDTTYGISDTDPNDPADCSEFKNLKAFSSALKLSKNYKLGDFNKGGWVLKNQAGLPVWKIVCNLKNIANNVLEPIRQKYPKVIISSGFRNLTSEFPNERSDHLRGCAVDVQFKTALANYRDIAVWIQENIPYKQLLLEYEQDSKGRTTKAWIHISLELAEVSGAPIPTGGVPVGTIVNHVFKYPNQLVNLA